MLAAAQDVQAAGPSSAPFSTPGRRRPARLLWLRHASDARGVLVLDQGAVRAVVQRNASLLPAGITAVRGTFSSGEARRSGGSGPGW